MRNPLRSRAASLVAATAFLLCGPGLAQEARTLKFTAASNKGHPQVLGVERLKLMDKLPARGLVGLAYWDLGFRQMHTTRKSITKADDLKGLKMRVIPTPIYVDFMNATGANAIPMPFTETYGALEQGSIDGMTNPLLNILDGKYNEVGKNLTMTNHMYTPQIVIVSKKTWDKLSPADLARLGEIAKPVIAKPTKSVGEEMVNDVNAELARMRAPKN